MEHKTLLFNCSLPPTKCHASLLPTPDAINVQSTSSTDNVTKSSGSASQQASTYTGDNALKENIKESDFEMPKWKTGRNKRCAAKCHDPLRNSIHPYQEVISRKVYKLKVLCDQIADIGACDLVIANHKSGENNYHPNMQIADQMDLASKELIKLSKKLNLKAEQIHENATAEHDNKRGIVFMSEVTDPKEKHELTQN